MIKFALCDDSINILEKVSKMLETIFNENNFNAVVAYSSTNTNDMLNYINNNKIDVIILDININSNKDGLNLAEFIRKNNKNTYIIFSTGHLEYIMLAYKYKTFDYLAKPLTYDRLSETIVRLFEDINGQTTKYIRIDNKNTLIDASEVQFIKRDGMKLVFHTTTRNYESYNSFNKIQNSLPANYRRCHKSCIANILQIKDIEPVSNTITFKDGSICSMGPKYKSDIMEVLQNNENI